MRLLLHSGCGGGSPCNATRGSEKKCSKDKEPWKSTKRRPICLLKNEKDCTSYTLRACSASRAHTGATSDQLINDYRSRCRIGDNSPMQVATAGCLAVAAVFLGLAVPSQHCLHETQTVILLLSCIAWQFHNLATLTPENCRDHEWEAEEGDSIALGILLH